MIDDDSAADQQPYFVQRLGIEADADERTIKRAYARELKLIDQEANPAGFQELREAYDHALFWHRNGLTLERKTQAPEQPAPCEEDPVQQRYGAPVWLDMGPREDGANDVTEDTLPEEELLAREVIADFEQRCVATPDMHVSESWKRELQVSLADARLIHIGARDMFEQHIANLLASGWKAEHHLLLFAATDVFHWASDRRRLHALGAAGYTLDCAIDQRAMYDLQPEEVCDLQREVIVRLRDAKAPSMGELLGLMPVLAMVEARFPTWLALISDTGNVARWHELDERVPKWRRRLKHAYKFRRLRVGQVWLALIGFWVIVYFAASLWGAPSKAPQSYAANQVLQANQHIDRGDTEGALAYFDRAIRTDPGNVPAYAGRAIAFLSLSDDKNAALDLDKLESLDPANPFLFRGRGMLAYKQKRHADALVAFTRALEIEPTHSSTRVWRAYTYERLNDQEKGIADAYEVLRSDPENIDARLVRARIFNRRNDKPSQLAEAKALLAANKGNAAAFIAAGRIYASAGEQSEAMAVVNRGIAEAPSEALYLYRAEGRDVKDVAGRRADIIAALKLNASSAPALFMRVRLELQAGQYDAAIAAADVAIHDESTRGERYILFASRAVALARLGRNEEAGFDFGMAKASARTPAHLNNVCWRLMLENIALDTALSFCDAALAKEPDTAAYLDSKAYVLLRMKRYREAIAAYDTALKLRADFESSLYGRGITKHRIGNVKGGDADIRAALAKEPGLAEFFTRSGLTP